MIYSLLVTYELVTLLSSGKEPEIHYVALRNINIICQKRPEILQNEVKVELFIFFMTYVVVGLCM